MTPRKPTSSTPNKNELEEEERKLPFKKTSPAAKYVSPINNVYPPRTTENLHVGSPPCNLLAKFGLKPAPKSNISPVASNRNLSQLKCCVIDGGVNSAILFRFEPIGTWSEKIMYDEIFVHHSAWTTELHFVERKLSWFHNNKAQKNDKNYAVRMFVIDTIEPVKEKENLIELGKHICTQVNGVENNRTVASVPYNEMDYFWIPEGAVWADVIGNDAASKQIIAIIGESNGHDDFYERNKDFIDVYFRSGTYPLNFARQIGARLDEVHPNERYEIVNPDTDEVNEVNSEINE